MSVSISKVSPNFEHIEDQTNLSQEVTVLVTGRRYIHDTPIHLIYKGPFWAVMKQVSENHWYNDLSDCDCVQEVQKELEVSTINELFNKLNDTNNDGSDDIVMIDVANLP